jgi:transcriptional regulator with PAS, ATPase and Fis domain
MLPQRGQNAKRVTGTLHLSTIEKQVIRRALAPYGGLKATRQEKEMVAAQLGISIATLYRKIKEEQQEMNRVETTLWSH